MTYRPFTRLLAAVAATTVSGAIALALPAGAQASMSGLTSRAASTEHPPAVGPAARATTTGSAGDARRACPAPARLGYATCFALMRTNVKPRKGLLGSAQAPSGYGPADLQSAYSLPSGSAGAGQTVAIVDAYDDPTAEADLQTYRAQYGLPACDSTSGCFEKVNQNGQQGSYPKPDPTGGWETEESLDVDMVSATCPSCHILLVEANNTSLSSLGKSVDEAVALGAKYVSNSYGTGGEFKGEPAYDTYYNHPGVVVTVAGGDYGYDNYQQGSKSPSYPASSPYVTSVGGTTLTQDSSAVRGWNETVWSGAGSGCSKYEPKPSWQTDTGCHRRTGDDVAADANPNTGVAVYDTYQEGGWLEFGGTSVASPIIASTYALAGPPPTGRYPSSFPYAETSGLNDVTSGTNYNQPCAPAYLCTAGPGYDGPTGLGTPDGIAAFSTGPTGDVAGTVTSATTGSPLAGATVDVGSYSTTTNQSGQYDIGAPPGSYPVTAKDFGYTTQTDQNIQVTAGQTVTENFALATAPRVRLSGTVTDGSGHGWPLPAKIDIAGDPASPVYSNPYTGAYQASLPEGSTYHLRVVPGDRDYQAQNLLVHLGSAPQARDITLHVDQAGCHTAGYTYTADGADFTGWAGTTPQDNWTLTGTTPGALGAWQFGNPFPPTSREGTGEPPGSDGQFAISGTTGQNYGSVDTSLVSPAVDLSGVTSPDIGFDTHYQGYSGQAGDVDLSLDGGNTWTTVWQQTTSTYDGPVTIPIPQAAGQSDVQFRFRFTANNGWWWSIDNVGIGPCAARPGGLVAGTVTDANTSAGVNGAGVASAADTAESATTAPAQDPALGSGFYEIFAATTGSQQFTASRLHYQTAAMAVSVTADTVAKADFPLKAGQISVTPGQVNATGMPGSNMTGTVTLTNTGTAPTTVKLAGTDRDAAVQASHAASRAGAPLQRIHGTFSPLAPAQKAATSVYSATATAGAQPSASPWTKITSYPESAGRNAVATDPATGLVYAVGGITGGEIYDSAYVYNPATKHWTQLPNMKYAHGAPVAAFIDGKLYVAGGYNNATKLPYLEIYDPGTGTWSMGARMPTPTYASGVTVMGGKMYVIGGFTGSNAATDVVQVYNPSANSWRQSTPYPEPIGEVSCGAPAGLIYCAGGLISAQAEVSDAFSYNPATSTWSPIARLPIPLWGSAYTAGNGQLLVSGGVTANSAQITNQGYAFSPWTGTWSKLPNAPHAIFNAGSACGFYEIGGQEGGGTIASAEHLPGYDTCGPTGVSWLSATPVKATLRPGQSTTVTVTLNAADASVTQPGTYTAGLIIENATPYQVPDIGVTMTVTPPNSWGEITGTVAASDGTPLAGATVQIGARSGTGQIYTTTTSADGQYSWWLPQADSPVQVIVSDRGYAPQTQKAKIAAGQTTTLNFKLNQR